MSGIIVVEVGPRDGLQNTAVSLDTGTRAEMCRRIAGAGVSRVEAVSFVDARRVPQMAGAEAIVAALGEDRRDGYCGLVLNERGAERLVASGLRDLRFAFAVTDAFNLRNSNRSTADCLARARRVLQTARGQELRSGVVVATAFGCPFAGEVALDHVIAIASELAEAGATEIVFADTVGVATPRQIRAVLRACSGSAPTLGVHLHNTRNTGYLNAFVAIEEGAEVIDASIGGLGGCPFAPGATGNIATEDIVYLLEREGIGTGIDLDSLIETALWLKRVSNLTLDGQVHRAGRFPAPSSGVRSSRVAAAG